MAGLCTRNYANVDKEKIDEMLNILSSNGAEITGRNPWEIETYQHGILLRAEWNETALTLSVSVTGRNWYVPNETIWSNIDSLMLDMLIKSSENDVINSGETR